MKIYIFLILLFGASLTNAQTAPVKWASQETFFEDLIGKDLPDFKGKTLGGKTFSKENLHNQILLINFWFEECPPCVKEILSLIGLLIDIQKTKSAL